MRSSTSIDLSDANWSRVGRAEIDNQQTVVLHLYEIPDVGEGNQRELAHDAVAGDGIAIKERGHSPVNFGSDFSRIKPLPTDRMSATLFAASSNRCLGDVVRHKVGFNKQALPRREMHVRQLLIHVRPRSNEVPAKKAQFRGPSTTTCFLPASRFTMVVARSSGHSCDLCHPSWMACKKPGMPLLPVEQRSSRDADPGRGSFSLGVQLLLFCFKFTACILAKSNGLSKMRCFIALISSSQRLVPSVDSASDRSASDAAASAGR